MAKKFTHEFARVIARVKKDAARAMKLGLLLVRTESVKRSPVDTGNLKASHYTTVEIVGNEIIGEVGLTAEYAAYVHENVNAHFITGEAMFLENAIEHKTSAVLKLLRSKLKFKS